MTTVTTHCPNRPGPARGARAARRPAPALLAALALLTLHACARSAQAPATAAAAEPVAPSPAQAEISALWDQIADERVQAGLVPTPAESIVTTGAVEAHQESYDESYESSAGADADAWSSDPDLGPEPERVAATIQAPADECPSADVEADECADSCTLAGSICDNAGRICRIAGELPGDAWARGKCADGAEVCRQATAQCCGCRGS
ncbi:hypothetical protein [Haliangium sp.]|uniref:hypothetical protein n=1 Tax=Haliangium sp. TaxID=2663208 RepID=UPI003D0B2FF5